MSGTKVDGTSTLMRPKFGPGMLLQHDDLDQLAAYTRDLNRLMFRSLFGCGVICGLVVKASQSGCGDWQITIGAGVALDCDGDPIYVPKDQTLAVDDTCNPNHPPVWVVLCGKSRSCAPRTAMCPTDEDETTSICTRERDGFEIRVVTAQPTCACSCVPPKDAGGSKGAAPSTAGDTDCWCADPNLPCLKDHYAGDCSTCGCGDCSGGCSDADCVILAHVTWDEKNTLWTPDHSVRRFIRPVLMRDPQAHAEAKAKEAAEQKAQEQAKEQAKEQSKEQSKEPPTKAGAAEQPAPAAPPTEGPAAHEPARSVRRGRSA